MNKKTISLFGEKELRIFMLPLRQQIIREMRIVGKPMTTKQIADKLNITPSSAKHHLSKLQELDLVKFHHSELINGITANYMELNDVNVRIGQNFDDEFNEVRDVYSQNILFEIYQGYQNIIKNNRPINNLHIGDFLTGIIHLSDEKALELIEMIKNFIDKNKEVNKDSNPYEFALVYYKTNSENEKEVKI